jgi:predicted outer membrane repeat protein
LTFMLFLGMLFVAGSAKAEVIYVNVNNLNPVQDGTSWNTAFVSLQSALDEAAISSSRCHSIWVAKGSYFPSVIYSPSGVVGGALGLSNPGLVTFDIPNNVSIFGGFNGTETNLRQRNPKKNQTVLNGGSTSWHVVTLGNDITQTGVNVKLDGLVINEGNANGPIGSNPLFSPFTFDHSSGGGVYAIFDSKVRIRNVLFINNKAADFGGALFSNNSVVHIEKSRFISNSTSGPNGGAIQVLNSFETSPHTATIESSFFEGNHATLFGGAVVAEGSIGHSESFAEIKGCTFKSNSAQVGGAVAIDSLKVNVLNSSFEENFASVAGGALSTTNVVNTFVTAFAQSQFTPFTTTITKCKFIQNEARGNKFLHDILFGGPVLSGIDFPFGGGAIAVYTNGYLDVYRSRFIGNEAQNSPGGAILNGNSAGENIIGSGADGFIAETKVTRSIFRKNRSNTENGGAIASLPSTYPFPTPLPITVDSTVLVAERSTFASNQAGLNGGAIYLNLTTATLEKDRFIRNRASLGNSIYAINSIINGDSTSPFVK